jgi:hypothetical protein
MNKIFNIIKNKKVISALIISFFILFIGLWSVVSGGYDKQNKTILFLKEFIPTDVSRKVRDIIFIIPNLKEKNKFLNTQVTKYEQGFNGELFNEEIVQSKNNKTSYLLKEFFLPFPRLDISLGWAATTNSLRAHYLALAGDKVIVISGEGKTIYFKKNNIFNKKLNQFKISNNIENILVENNFKLIGIRDLFINDDKVYISLIFKNLKGYSINIYKADLDIKKLNFKLFFETKTYWPDYTVFTGGRLSNFKDNKVLFSTGYASIDNVAQDEDSLLGKIISIDKQTNKHQIVSIGHRNPQGLLYIENSNIIVNTEHGPKGGDEINLNFLKDDKVVNYGWDIASYGIAYDGTDPYKKSHIENGFVEPFKKYSPSIGISQIVYLPKNLNSKSEKHFYISSLRAASLYITKIDGEFNKIIDEDRLFFKNQRIRDMEYDSENNLFFLLFETTPSIGVLKLNN